MKIYDISQEVFSCEVYQGDPAPERNIIASTENGDLYNLTAFSMCAHNGTHIDAPFHFLNNGKKVDEIPLHKFVGNCNVVEFDGILTAADAEKIIKSTKAERILFKGKTVVSSESAKTFAKSGICLLGVESQTVGDENAPMAAHIELLSQEIVILEGIRLKDIPSGEYFLCAQPILLGESDGAPCRAILIDFAQC